MTDKLTTPKRTRRDLQTLGAGIVFCVLVTLAIWLFGSRLKEIAFLPDEGYAWYYWKLPQKTQIGWWSAWGLYTAHQLSHFGLIFYAQKHVGKYTTGLHPVNLWALAINGVFVLLMENGRRGLVLGKKVPIGKQIASFAIKYHGYVFSWAILYTFWYHPMYSSISHLSGFLYTLLIMLQGSLFFTRVHTNRYWTFVQEFSVLIHGSLVAYTQGPNVWPMFLFGFAGLFIFTQMHGLGLSRLVRWGFAGVYISGIVWVYRERGIERLGEIARIPVAEYLLVVILALVIGAGLLVFNLASGRIGHSPPDSNS